MAGKLKGVPMLSVVFPTLNEEKNIGKTLSAGVRVLGQFPGWEIIIVDNASTDRTVQIVRRMQRKEPRIRLVLHKSNLGYAKSTEDGLRTARGEFILVIDGDGQHDLRDISRFIESMQQGYDLVVGWKRVRHDPPSRVLMAKAYNLLFRALFGGSLHDVDCGFKGYRRQLAKRLSIEYHNVPVGAEICAKAGMMGFRIGELEVAHFPRKAGKSSFHPLKMPLTVARVFVSLFILRVRIAAMRKDR